MTQAVDNDIIALVIGIAVIAIISTITTFLVMHYQARRIKNTKPTRKPQKKSQKKSRTT